MQNRLDAFLSRQERGRKRSPRGVRDFPEEKLARAAGTTQSIINRLRHRSMNASLERALLIEQATGGAVPAESLPLSRTTAAALRAMRPRSKVPEGRRRVGKSGATEAASA